MAFLLLLHEKMRLQRKVNKLTLRQTQLSSRKERITKNISKVQKMYSSKMTMLEKQAQMMQNSFTTQLQNAWGLGTQNQMFNPMMGGGITSFVANQLGAMLSGGAVDISDGKGGKTSVDISGVYQNMLSEYMAGTLKAQTGEDGKPSGMYGADGTYTKDEYQVFMRAMQAAQGQQANAQMMQQQLSAQYQSNMSIWLAAQKAQLEEEQDAALLPLEAEETDIDLDNQSCEAQLADAKARLDSIKQACSEGIKDSAPTFGLG